MCKEPVCLKFDSAYLCKYGLHAEPFKLHNKPINAITKKFNNKKIGKLYFDVYIIQRREKDMDLLDMSKLTQPYFKKK